MRDFVLAERNAEGISIAQLIGGRRKTPVVKAEGAHAMD
jgi:hypothetical protein